MKKPHASTLTGRLAGACAWHPVRTLVSWALAVVVSLGLVATSLHLGTNGT